MTAKEYFTCRRDQIELDFAADLEKRLAQINAGPEDDDKKKSLRDWHTQDLKMQKEMGLQRVGADEKDRQANLPKIEAGSWVTIHWLIPFRQDGARKQRAATISGEVQSVQLDRAQVTFVCNSRPDDEEIKLHKIEKDSLVEAPLDCVTSVSL